MTAVSIDGMKKVHFTGIGGVSMSGLAEILHKRGFTVSGSDVRASNLTEHLSLMGIPIYLKQQRENIKEDMDLLVYTNAINEDNEELLTAREYGITTIDRATLLGLIMKEYQYPISIAGTHGKTTTTSFISQIFLNGQKDPTISVGGVFNRIGGNFRMGNSPYFIVESCEYFDNFLKFFPYVGIILNVEKDHIDYFKSMEQLEDSFNRFAQNIDAAGLLIINSKIKNFDRIVKDIQCPILEFGDSQKGVGAENIVYSKEGLPSFDVYVKGHFKCHITLKVPGEHNIQNALASFACAYFFNMPAEVIKDGLESFEGANRRFEYKGEKNGIKVIDDYAHHPTEIKTTLKAAKTIDHNKLYCVFQPHTYTRTKAFLDEFAASFKDADTILLLDIYAARENDQLGVHSSLLAEKIRENGGDAHYFKSFSEAKKFLAENCIPRDLLITMGAGDVYLLGETFLYTDLSTLSTDF